MYVRITKVVFIISEQGLHCKTALVNVHTEEEEEEHQVEDVD